MLGVLIWQAKFPKEVVVSSAFKWSKSWSPRLQGSYTFEVNHSDISFAVDAHNSEEVAAATRGSFLRTG